MKAELEACRLAHSWQPRPQGLDRSSEALWPTHDMHLDSHK